MIFKKEKENLKKGHLHSDHARALFGCPPPPLPVASSPHNFVFLKPVCLPRFRCRFQGEVVGASGLELDTVLRHGAVQKTEITTAQPPGKYT